LACVVGRPWLRDRDPLYVRWGGADNRLAGPAPGPPNALWRLRPDCRPAPPDYAWM